MSGLHWVVEALKNGEIVLEVYSDSNAVNESIGPFQSRSGSRVKLASDLESVRSKT